MNSQCCDQLTLSSGQLKLFNVGIPSRGRSPHGENAVWKTVMLAYHHRVCGQLVQHTNAEVRAHICYHMLRILNAIIEGHPCRMLPYPCMSLFIFPIPAAPKACGASQPTGALWPLARASSRSASPPATYASLTGGAFQAPSDLDAGGGAARLHLRGK